MRLCMLADIVERVCAPCLPSCFLTRRCSQRRLALSVAFTPQTPAWLSLVVRRQKCMTARPDTKLMRAALKRVVVPELHRRGFAGTLPHFRRVVGARLAVMSFQFDKWGGGF